MTRNVSELRDCEGLIEFAADASLGGVVAPVSCQDKGLRGDLPSPALSGSGPRGRHSATRLSGFSAFPAANPVSLDGSQGPAPSLASQTL